MNKLLDLKSKIMFHKLGFEKFDFLITNDILIHVKFYNHDEILTLTETSISYTSQITNRLPVKYLPAIIQLYKELGWLNE